MNREEWLGKFEYWNTQMNDMLKAIHNFDRLKHTDDFVIKKSRNYYIQLNTITLKINEVNSNRYQLRISTFEMENKVRRARELLKEAFEKRGLGSKWDSLLADIDRKY